MHMLIYVSIFDISIITSFIKDWFTNEKAENINVSIESDSEEREASTGSACSITVL